MTTNIISGWTGNEFLNENTQFTHFKSEWTEIKWLCLYKTDTFPRWTTVTFETVNGHFRESLYAVKNISKRKCRCSTWQQLLNFYYFVVLLLHRVSYCDAFRPRSSKCLFSPFLNECLMRVWTVGGGGRGRGFTYQLSVKIFDLFRLSVNQG